MNKAKKNFRMALYVSIIFGFLLVSCGTTSGTFSNKMSRIEVGMTKAQVTAIMGNPTDRSVSGNTERWHYWDSWNGSTANIYFTDGLVSGMNADNR